MKIKLKNFYIFSGCFLLILSIFLIFPNSANAGWATNALINGFGWIIYAIVFTIGWFTSFLLGWLFQVASYSNFINVDTVTKGWVIIRDLCNMFFILILLVVAFATILRIESYQWKKILPKLLIMAVLINFSKTICGLITDFSQVIMLTFVNGISGGAANLTSLLGMDKMMSFNTSDKAGDLGLETVAGLILALLSSLVTLVVIVVMIAMLVMRVVMIWIYVILSPIAFLAAAFPAGQKYSSQWWGEFSKQVISGPVLAFFLWLALVTAQTASTSLGLESITAAGLKDGIITSLLAGATFQKYIITMGLLVGGLMVTQQIGGIAGSLAGKGMAAINKGGSLIGKTAGSIGKFGMFKAGRMADTLQMKGQGLLAKGVAKVTKGTFGEKYQAKSLNYRMIKEGWDRGQAVKMRDYEGTKAGAWQDQFNRTTSASIGIPIVSQIMQKKAEKKAKDHENKMKDEIKLKEQDEKELKDTPVNDVDKQNEIKDRIKGREEKISEHKKNMGEEIKKSQESWTLGKLPPQRYMRLQEQERGQAAYSRIAKEEDLSEENKVHSFQAADRAGNESDKRAYMGHLADSNSINALFDDMGEDFNPENIIKVFTKKFGDAAGDVLAEVSRRAEAVGNYKFMGLHKFDVAQGRNRVATVGEQSDYVARKDNEKYAQNHARTTHFDSLYDKTEKDGLTLSDNGRTQLLHIASSTGRMKEIGNGNYQTRYGEMVIKLEANIRDKAAELNSSGREADKADAAGLIKVLEAFKENYGPGALAAKARRKKQSGEEETVDNG